MKQKLYDASIRVNLAGEKGARQIYAGQLWALRLFYPHETKAMHDIQDMDAQEAEHVKIFENLAKKHHSRPTVLQPLWNVCGFSIGAITGLMGAKAAMLCTKAVEDVIEQHYQDQLDTGFDDQEIKEAVQKCQEDEIHHQNIGKSYTKEYHHPLLYKAISTVTKLAIFYTKKL